MSAFDKWEVAGVLPGDYEDYGNWVLQKGSEVLTKSGGGIVYHKHYDNETQKITLIVTDTKGKCRICGEPAPLGIIFRARTTVLDEVDT
jgi:hypothetical protein